MDYPDYLCRNIQVVSDNYSILNLNCAKIESVKNNIVSERFCGYEN